MNQKLGRVKEKVESVVVLAVAKVFFRQPRINVMLLWRVSVGSIYLVCLFYDARDDMR